MKRALVVWGGWDGHEPERVAGLFEETLAAEGFEVEVSDTLAAFDRPLDGFDLIVPVWTMGEIAHSQCQNVCRAVAESGVGLAGCHGGMCDAFRGSTEWQFMTGGQWVAHPGDDGVRYTVCLRSDHSLTQELADFEVVSEQYYLHTDPANDVFAWCDFPNPTVDEEANRLVEPCRMPQGWTRGYGNGRVFYLALGHRRDVIEAGTPRELLRRGALWAAR
jgi:uncharacterized protein